MRSFVVRILIMALFTGAAAAAEPWQQELAGPLVKIAAGQMIFEEFELCAIPADAECIQTEHGAAAEFCRDHDDAIALACSRQRSAG